MLDKSWTGARSGLLDHLQKLCQYSLELNAHQHHRCQCKRSDGMAQLSACMRHAPCNAAVDAAASRLRWKAFGAELCRQDTTSAARAVGCNAHQRHDFSQRPALHMLQVGAGTVVSSS
jgi:hypothetical protein